MSLLLRLLRHLIMVGLSAWVAGCSVTQTVFTPNFTPLVSSSPTNKYSTPLPPLSSTPTKTRPTATLTPSPQPSLTPSRTLGPTLDLSSQESRVKELLIDNGGCQIPCVWGIVPGHSSWDETWRFFAKMGYSPQPFVTNQGFTRWSVEIGSKNLTYGIGFNFIERDGIVQFMSFAVAGKSIYKIAPSYELRNFMKSTGIPSRVYLAPGFIHQLDDPPVHTAGELYIMYDQLGTMASYFLGGVRIDNRYRICPNDPYRFIEYEKGFFNGARLIIQSSDSNLSLEDAMNFFGTKFPSDARLIDEVTSLDTSEFFNLVVNPTNSDCFETEILKWGD